MSPLESLNLFCNLFARLLAWQNKTKAMLYLLVWGFYECSSEIFLTEGMLLIRNIRHEQSLPVKWLNGTTLWYLMSKKKRKKRKNILVLILFFSTVGTFPMGGNARENKNIWESLKHRAFYTETELHCFTILALQIPSEPTLKF